MKLEHWPYLLTILLLTLLLLKDCGESDSYSPHTDTIRTETILRYDTVIHTVERHNYHVVDLNKKIEPVADTSQLISDYFTQRQFSDTLKDSSIEAVYSGMLWKNSLFNPSFTYKILRPQSITYNTVVESRPKTRFLLGGFAMYNDKPTVGAVASLQMKSGVLISGGYGTGKTYYGGVQWPIKLRK